MIIDPDKFTIIAGPCVLEGYDMAIDIATQMAYICNKLGFNYIFKGSFDKANRTSIHSFRGLPFEKSMDIFRAIRKNGIATTTDVHETYQIKELVGVIDIIQIPALLCRQTDLLLDAADYFDYINIKKGQFASPKTMSCAAEKIYQYTDGEVKCVLLTERGTTFGYNDLVVDMRSINAMRLFCDFVLFDATHSCQKPGDSVTGGDSSQLKTLTKCAIVSGAHGIFFETCPIPSSAKSDAGTQMPLDYAERFIKEAIVPYITRGFNYHENYIV